MERKDRRIRHERSNAHWDRRANRLPQLMQPQPRHPWQSGPAPVGKSCRNRWNKLDTLDRVNQARRIVKALVYLVPRFFSGLFLALLQRSSTKSARVAYNRVPQRCGGGDSIIQCRREQCTSHLAAFMHGNARKIRLTFRVSRIQLNTCSCVGNSQLPRAETSVRGADKQRPGREIFQSTSHIS